jgi:hypothetical protein
MLERRQKEKEAEEEATAKSRNFGFIPGTTLHSSYVNKSYEQDSRLSGWGGSASNLRAASSYSSLTAGSSTADEEAASTTSSSYRKRELATGEG